MNQPGAPVENASVAEISLADTAGVVPDLALPGLDSSCRVGDDISAHAPPAGNLGRSVLKNSVAQIVGRLLIALLRLAVAGIIVRSYGKQLFGEYSLLFGIFSIADWLVDFGTTDVFVREICREPKQGQHMLRILTAVKLVQAPAAFAVLAAIVFALHYPRHIVEAALVGGSNMLFYSGVLVYRVIYRVTLTIEREVVSELISVVFMIPMVALVCRHHWGLVGLTAAHALSRVIFFGVCLLLGKSRFRLSLEGVKWSDVKSSLHSSVAIGIIGFLVGGYETTDILILSKLGSFSELAYYSAAQRLVWPMLMALAAMVGSFYPVIASYWPHDRERFEAACQRTLDTILLLAGFAVCATLAGARFFMGLLGPDLVSGAAVLRVFALLCFVKAITSTVGPVLYIVRAQKRALQFIAIALAVKVAVMLFVAPRYGYMGVAYSALAVEFCFGAVPAVFLLQHISGYRFRWGNPGKVAAAILISSLAPHFLFSATGLAAAVISCALYLPLIMMSGALRLSEVQSLLRPQAA